MDICSLKVKMRICFLFGDGIDEHPPNNIIVLHIPVYGQLFLESDTYIDGHFFPGS